MAINIAKITIAYDGAAAYTLQMRAFSITDNLDNSLTAGGQIIKSGLDSSVEITGTVTISQAVYDKLRENFIATWNSGKKGSCTVTHIVEGKLRSERVFNKAVIKNLNMINSIDMGADVVCNISISAREEEGINDYFSDPLLGV